MTLLRYTLSTSGRPSNPSSQTLALLNQSLPQIHFLRKIITTGLSTAYPGLSTDPPHSPPIVSMNIYLSIYLYLYIYIHIHIYTHTHAYVCILYDFFWVERSKEGNNGLKPSQFSNWDKFDPSPSNVNLSPYSYTYNNYIYIYT